jgi:hypothetical protein
MPSDIGSQQISVKYYDAVDSAVVNRIGTGVRKTGIYSGGYLTIVSDTSVSLSTFTCEITDGTYQVKASTGVAVTITVGVATPYVVLRWAYTGSATADYVDFVATATPATNDLIIGKCVYSGSTLVGFTYSERNNPQIMDLFLKVESMETPSMRVRVRAGKINYGSVNYDIVDQYTSLITAPASGSRIDLIQINTSGTVIVTAGVAASSPTAPDYGGLVTLAEITIASTSTTIISSMIKDTRNFIGSTSTLVSILSSVYPIGSIYTATVSTSPATLFGFGTWSAFGAGRVLVGKATSGTFVTAGATGGEETHLLTAAESGLPAHYHTTNAGAGTGRAGESPPPCLYTPGTPTSTAGPLNAVSAHNNLQPYIVVYMWQRTA